MSMRQLKQIDRDLARIHSKLSFFAINPTNVDEEQKKFFASKDYNPQFEYSIYRTNLKILIKKLKEMKPGNSTIGRILKQQSRYYTLFSRVLQNRGNDKQFTKYSIKLYGEPDQKLVRAARKFLKLRTPREKEDLTTKQVIKEMKKAFRKYGFDWEIREKDMVSKAAVNNSDRAVLLRTKTKYSKDIVKRLIVHELGTHVMRIENGKRQPFKIFEIGFPGYLMTEEGLAVVNEELNNCLSNRTLKIYAGRVLAINYALKYSFRETYNYLKKYFAKSLAFRLTIRAKRGLKDTSLPGACTKDIAYLKGYLAVKEYIKKGGDVDKLYYGKVGVQHTALLDKIPGLIHPYYLPMFRYMRYFMGHFSKIFASIVIIGLTPIIILKPIGSLFKPITEFIRPAFDPLMLPLGEALKPLKKRFRKDFKKLVKGSVGGKLLGLM